MYGQLVRAPEQLRKAATPYVSVRVTDMQSVDIDAIRFDFDLTLAVVLMHPHGTIYHRYGSRPADGPTAWSSVDGLCTLLKESIPEHAAHVAARVKHGVDTLPKWTPAIDRPALQHFLGDRQRPNCIHCHTIHESQQRYARAQGSWRKEDRWLYPEPARIGLQMQAKDQSLIATVQEGSSAAEAGLRAGDRILGMGRQPRVLTIADMMWALHGLKSGPTMLATTYQRSGETRDTELKLRANWKVVDAEQYAWRPYKWGLSPAPGFGGPALDSGAKRSLGLDTDSFAFRVQYMVTWGPDAHRGRAVAKAGLRKGDVVISFAGKSDFASIDHFHAWVRLGHDAGELVEIEIHRDGHRQTLRYKLPK
ncbi:MAG: Trx7/PDZ domain-containing (seleno)protein [Planctomycetota bacterium]